MSDFKNPNSNQKFVSEINSAREQIKKVYQGINSVILGKQEVIKKLIIAILANGHVLLYDVPGVGKTMLARTLAKTVNADFKRIQFTPDLLPSDVTGVSVYDPAVKQFEFQPGPVFTNILLADEINRTSPKTQSSLLEAMEERQVSADNQTHNLPGFFFVIATQNPVEHDGTYPLPIAQLDRFLMRIEMGYPDKDTEMEIVQVFSSKDPLSEVSVQINDQDVLKWQNLTQSIYMSPKLAQYCVNLSRKTRELSDVNVGISTRGAIRLAKAAKGVALLNGRDYAIPDDVLYIVENVFSHRLSEADKVGETIVKEVVSRVVI